MKAGDIVYYYLGEGEHQSQYVAIILNVLDEKTGKCFIRVINEGKADHSEGGVSDHNTDAEWALEPTSFHWTKREDVNS